MQGVSDAAPTKSSFVAEVNRDVEVWNFPVWGFTADISAPRPVRDEPAAKRVFRDPAAVSVADVTTRMIYAGGVQPRTGYGNDTDRSIDWDALDRRNTYSVATYHYTLEFDASGLIVGGEWRADHRGEDTPDFIWRMVGSMTDLRKDGSPSMLKYSLIKQLVTCSQQPNDTQVPAANGTVAAVRCAL